MEEIKCPFCGRFIGKESAGRLYDRKNKLISETGIEGYCISCRNYIVWKPAGLMTIEESNKPLVTVVEWTPDTGATNE